MLVDQRWDNLTTRSRFNLSFRKPKDMGNLRAYLRLSKLRLVRDCKGIYAWT